jgi:hypothetical protein
MAETCRGWLVRSEGVLPPHLEAILGSAVDAWATIFVAIGTVGAVAYALFRDLVIEPGRRPELDLCFDDTGDDLVVIATAGESMQSMSGSEPRTDRERRPPTTWLSW